MEDPRIEQLFNKLKTRDKPYMSFEAFISVLKVLFKNMADKELVRIYRIIDVDDSETLDINEFRFFFQVLKKGPFTSAYEIYFTLADSNSNNSLDFNEVKRLIHIMEFSITDEELEKLLKFYAGQDTLDCRQFCQFFEQVEQTFG